MAVMADAGTHRLTVILSGAVSLGAYEGGVIAQIAYALGKWNEARPDAPPRAVIDVIAGASAGSMTGAMLAHHLMTGSKPSEFVERVRESWCGASTTLPELLRMREGDTQSILSSRLVDEIAQQFFRPESGDPERIRQQEVIFTCTLTALDAIPYTFRMFRRHGLQPFQAWTRRDWITFSVTADPNQPLVELPTGYTRTAAAITWPDWKRLISVAVASGAFPAAFQPMKVWRPKEHYPAPLKQKPGGDWVRMRYTDGGVLDNMPFQRAAEALQSLEGRAPDERRSYVLIEVEPYRCGLDANAPGEAFQEARRDPTAVGDVLAATFSAMRQQALYSDLSQAQKVNRQLGWKDEFLLPALAAAADAVQDLAAAEGAAREALQGYLAEKWAVPRPTVEAELECYRALARLSEHPIAKAAAGIRPECRDLFLLQVALVEHVTGLRHKCRIRVEPIGPAEPRLLAGESIGAFGGFLDQDLTRHDFLCGLQDAYAWLVQWAEEESWEVPAAVDWFDDEPRGRQLARRDLSQFPSDMLEGASDLAIRRGVSFMAELFRVPQNLFTGAAQAVVRGLLHHWLQFGRRPDIPKPANPGQYRPQDHLRPPRDERDG